MSLVSEIIVILTLLKMCNSYAPAANPPMLTHASMDVGNIISIVIPESPDENINVEQLTSEFRQQLERIKKQSRASKVEHGLVTLKRVLPEMSREEKRKTLPMIRRVLHGRRVPSQGSTRNWTRQSRLEQFREGGQYMRGRSAGSPEERRIYHDYEEAGNREGATTRNDLMSSNRENYHKMLPNRWEDSFRREDQVHRDDQGPTHEDPIRHNDHIHQEESIRRHYTERHEVIPEDDVQGKMLRPQQDWNNPNWEDQSRVDGRIYPESSTIDCDYKLDRSVRQKDPLNEILRSEKLDKTPEEMSTDCTKVNQRIAPRYNGKRQDGMDNGKRNVNEFRGFESPDAPTYGNYPKDSETNTAVDPNCDEIKRNHSSQSSKESQTIGDSLNDKLQSRGPTNFDFDEYKGLRKFIQDPREPFERSNVSSFENIASESLDNYNEKKKRGQKYSQNQRTFALMHPGVGDRWNPTAYADRQPVNSSDENKDSSNIYEIFGEKPGNSGPSYIQTEQGGFRLNVDSERKPSGSQASINYSNDAVALRIQRAIDHSRDESKTPIFSKNATVRSDQIDTLNVHESIFERLRRLFRVPASPIVSYSRVILVYGNDSRSHEEKDRETFTEAEKTQFTSSPSMAGPSSSTSHDLPRPDRPMADSPRIPIAPNIGLLRNLPGIQAI